MDRAAWQDTLDRLRRLRRGAWCAFAGELLALAWAGLLLGQQPGLRSPFLEVAAPVLFFAVALPLALVRLERREGRAVAAAGDAWRIGRYGEAELRRLAQETAAALPPRLRRPQLRVVDQRHPNAWTWLSLLCPGRERHQTVWLTAGALHYLDPDELRAVILHELGHHLPAHRCGIPGGWLLGEVALLCLALGFGSRLYLDTANGIWLLYLGLRLAATFAVSLLNRGRRPAVELLCDAVAAAGAGRVATANMLLKLAEEQELVEAVQARVARRLRRTPHVLPEDIEEACAAVRPYGRIFHENLFRHAAETTARLMADLPQRKDTPARRPEPAPQNPDLAAHLATRRALPRRRVRWRRFDTDGDGRLNADELDRLCAFLHAHPDHLLCRSAT